MHSNESFARRAYENTLKNLEDMRDLSHPDLAPLLSQVQFHLKALFSSVHSDSKLQAVGPALRELSLLEIKKRLTERFSPRSGVKTLTYALSEALSYQALENALLKLDDLTSLIDALKPREIHYTATHEGYEYKIEVTDDEKLFEARTLAYALTQEQLKEKAVMSYQLTQHHGRVFLTFKVQYSDLCQPELSFSFGQFEFESIFSKFEISASDFISMSQHQTILINQNGEAALLNEKDWSKNFEATYLHLPFLFRPLSIIILGRGVLKPKGAYQKQISLFHSMF